MVSDKRTLPLKILEEVTRRGRKYVVCAPPNLLKCLSLHWTGDWKSPLLSAKINTEVNY